MDENLIFGLSLVGVSIVILTPFVLHWFREYFIPWRKRNIVDMSPPPLESKPPPPPTPTVKRTINQFPQSALFTNNERHGGRVAQVRGLVVEFDDHPVEIINDIIITPVEEIKEEIKPYRKLDL